MGDNSMSLRGTHQMCNLREQAVSPVVHSTHLQSNAKLSAEQVAEIRARSDRGERRVDLGREFGVHSSAITRIAKRQSYKNAYQRDFLSAFWSKVDVCGAHECWPWMGGRLRKGYGHLNLRYMSTTAHRVAYELSTGVELPDELEGCHTCDNPPCCNPSHIFPGTTKENAEDCSRKNRHNRVPSFGRRILTAEQVAEIRFVMANIPKGHRWSGSPKTNMRLGFANRFGVNVRTIIKVERGETWNQNTERQRG